MSLHDVVTRRRSVRAYRPDAVADEQLDRILEAMRLAPSAGNLQAFQVVVVRAADRRRALAQAAIGQGFLGEAPIVLVFFADGPQAARRYGQRGVELYALQDAAIAASYAQLAAHDLGLGTVWVGAFRDAQVSAVVAAPSHLLPVALLAIGHPAEQPAPTPRRALGELVHAEQFGGSPHQP